MPLPLLALAAPLAAWGTRALATYGLARLFCDNSIEELEKMVTDWIVGQVAERAGLQLDPAAPFSDASFAGAVSQKTGIPLRSLRDRQMILEDVDDYAAGLVSSRLGYRISSFRNLDRARADFEVAALAMLTAKTGIPFAPLEGEGITPDYIKAQVEDWARAKISQELAGNASQALAVLGETADFESLAASVNQKLELLGNGNLVTAKGLALEIAEQLAAGSVTRFQQTAMGISKKDRRALQLRQAQRKFRAKWGNRMDYRPLQPGEVPVNYEPVTNP